MKKLYKYINPKELMKMSKSQKRVENILKQVMIVLTQNGKKIMELFIEYC